jgi:hypothetical protein
VFLTVHIRVVGCHGEVAGVGDGSRVSGLAAAFARADATKIGQNLKINPKYNHTTNTR